LQSDNANKYLNFPSAVVETKTVILKLELYFSKCLFPNFSNAVVETKNVMLKMFVPKFIGGEVNHKQFTFPGLK